jgi:hypothetical protein
VILHHTVGAVAHHESGHSIACCVFSIPFSSVRLCGPEEMEDALGYVMVRERQAPPRHRLLMIAAGPLAEKAYAGESASWDYPDAEERREFYAGVRALAEQTGRDFAALADELFCEAQALVRREWAAIERVARALVERRLLTNEEVLALWRPPAKRESGSVPGRRAVAFHPRRELCLSI